ncbi:hypothetical protein C7E12_07665 [Stenotrophomonas maltophilia]|nr:hypothetical protein C7E12_07665 [Stenotrophomonas maltophilia]
MVEAYGRCRRDAARAGYQRHTACCCRRRSGPPLHGVLAQLVPQLYALPEARKVRWSLDVDPTDLY